MKIFPLVLILISPVFAPGCGPASRHRTAALLDDVETFINERPDSALAVLRALDSTAVRSRALRARASLLHSMALDKCYIDLQTDSVLAPAIAWYGRHGTADEKIKTLYYQGRLQYNAGDFQEAIVTYTEALELTDRATDKKYIGFVNQAIADTYCATDLEPEAITYLNQAYNCFKECGDSLLAFSTQYKVATVYATVEKPKNAETLFKELLNQNLTSALRFRVLSDYALFLGAHTDNSALSLHFFDQTLEDYGALLSPNHWAVYAYVLARENRSKESEEVFKQMEASYGRSFSLVYWQGRVAEDKGNFALAFQSLSHSLSSQDSLVRKSLSQSAIRSQKQYYQIKMQEAESRLDAQHLRIWLVAITVLLFTIVISFIVFIRIKNYKSLTGNYLQLMENMNQRLSELQDNHKQLFQAYLYVYGQLSEEYERTKTEGRLDSISFRKLKRVIANLKGAGKGTFEEIINHEMGNLMGDFRKDFEGVLSEDEMILSSYLFCGFDTSTASTLLGISPEAYYMRKSRIKKRVTQHNNDNTQKYLSYFEKRRS